MGVIVYNVLRGKSDFVHLFAHIKWESVLGNELFYIHRYEIQMFETFVFVCVSGHMDKSPRDG